MMAPKKIGPGTIPATDKRTYFFRLRETSRCPTDHHVLFFRAQESGPTTCQLKSKITLHIFHALKVTNKSKTFK